MDIPNISQGLIGLGNDVPSLNSSIRVCFSDRDPNHQVYDEKCFNACHDSSCPYKGALDVSQLVVLTEPVSLVIGDSDVLTKPTSDGCHDSSSPQRAKTTSSSKTSIFVEACHSSCVSI